MDTDAQLSPLEDACTVVLLRDGTAGLETLMLERPASSSSFGGAWVFPGGKVDPGDRENEQAQPLDGLGAALAAGIRELAEETGQRLAAADLVWLSQWTPMQNIPRRFRTWFMLAPAAPGPIILNPAEHTRCEWLRPAAALNRHAEGTMKLVPPTWVTLHHLAGLDSTAQALTAARSRTPVEYNSHLLMPGTGTRPAGVLWAGDEAYPTPDGSSTQGARHRLTMTSLPWVFEHVTPEGGTAAAL